MLLDELDQIDEHKLRELCKSKCPESSTLDFKQQLPSIDEHGKKSFLKDVCAFANADGGDLVYGISEEAGGAKAIVPIVDQNSDDAQRRLTQILDAGVEPRLQGIQMRPIPVEGGYVLVARIPSSFNGPHRYKFKTIIVNLLFETEHLIANFLRACSRSF